MSRLWRYGAKSTVEQVFCVDIRQMKKAGYLDGNYYSGRIGEMSGSKNNVWFAISTDPEDEFLGGRYIRFVYSVIDQRGETIKYDYKIPISVTKCYFGGVRYWFRCYANLRHCCGNRVTTLYLMSGANIFACRHCYDLSYNSRNKDRKNAFYPIFESSRLGRERDGIIHKKGFRLHYAGKLTRRGKRAMKIYRKINAYKNSLTFRK